MENKLTAEELADLKGLNLKYGEILSSLGECDTNIHDLEAQIEKQKQEKSNLLLDYMTVKIRTEDLSKVLVDKYGTGKIDLSTGEIEII
jgi:hypothetical protein